MFLAKPSQKHGICPHGRAIKNKEASDVKQAFKNFFSELKTLLSSVPPLTFALFLLSVFAMNLLANKSLNIPLGWLALDCGIVVSWVAFLCMDVLTKRFGPKAATLVSVTAILLNVAACVILYLSSLIPGTWGAFYDYGEAEVVNEALDSTIGGTWYVLFGSTVAFISSACINNFANWGIGKMFAKRPDGFLAYALRTYLSTAVAQLADNLIFALIVSHFFFGWTMLQCFTCAATGMVAELLVEAVFSPLGFRVLKKWEKDGVGEKYLALMREKETA